MPRVRQALGRRPGCMGLFTLVPLLLIPGHRGLVGFLSFLCAWVRRCRFAFQQKYHVIRRAAHEHIPRLHVSLSFGCRDTTVMSVSSLPTSLEHSYSKGSLLVSLRPTSYTLTSSLCYGCICFYPVEGRYYYIPGIRTIQRVYAWGAA